MDPNIGQPTPPVTPETQTSAEQAPQPTVPTQIQTPLVTPSNPKTSSRKTVYVSVLILLILAVVGGVCIFYVSNNRATRYMTKQTSQISKKQFSSQSLANKIIYGVQKGNAQVLYASDYNGSQMQIGTINAAQYPISLSPDHTKLVYEKNGDTTHLFIYDFSKGLDTGYMIATSPASMTTIDSVKWEPDSKEVAFIVATNVIPLDPSELSHPITDIISRFGLLDVDTGIIQILNLSQTPMANEIEISGMNKLGFFASTKQTLYIFESTLCTPGPCFVTRYSFNWKTQAIKKLQPLDNVLGDIADINPQTEAFLFGDPGLDVYSGSTSASIGQLQLFSPMTSTVTTLASGIGYVFISDDAKFIDDHTLLYSKTKTVDPDQAASSTPVPTEWYIHDLTTNTEKQIPYSGYDLKPLTEIMGIIAKQRDQDRLSLIDFNNGTIKTIYESKQPGTLSLLNN